LLALASLQSTNFGLSSLHGANNLEEGYLKIQATSSEHQAPFCVGYSLYRPQPLQYKHPKTGQWQELGNPFCGMEDE